MRTKALLLSAALVAAGVASSFAGDAYKWSVQYLIDNSRTIAGHSQKVSPRRNRGGACVQRLHATALRPAPFGTSKGFRFDLSFTNADGLQMKGMALACGKINSTQLSCQGNKKNS